MTADFIMRRARWFTAMSMVLALGLLALALSAILNPDPGMGMTGGLMFLAVGGFYLWQTVSHARDPRPVAAVTRAGLDLPGAIDQTIAWRDILRVDYREAMFAGSRVDVDVDPEVFIRMRMGQRAMGDTVVRRRGVNSGFSILSIGLDRDAKALYAAIRQHWPAEPGS